MRKRSALLLLAHILVLPLVAQSQSAKVLSDYIKEINSTNATLRKKYTCISIIPATS